MISKAVKVYPSLCQGCGACSLVCPENAIHLIQTNRGGIYPEVDYSKCTGCKVCYDACPVNLKNIESDILDSLVGYSTSREERFLASSGGVVSSIVRWALEKKFIDAFICVRASSDAFWKAEFSLISDPSEIYRIRTSRYIPVSLDTAFKDLEGLRRYKRIGFVGLGCHLRAVSNLRKILNLENIYFTIGLICKQTKDKRFVDYILGMMDVDKKNVEEFFYRTCGYPGKIVIKLKDGSRKEYPYRRLGFLWSNFYFAPVGCFFCTDPLAEYADIVIGDIWSGEFKESLGISLVFTRNQKGQAVIRKAFSDGFIDIKPFEEKKGIRCQNLRYLKFKKEYFQEKLLLLKVVQSDLPYRDFEFKKPANLFKIFHVIRVFLFCKLLERLLVLNIYNSFYRNLVRYLSIFLKL